MGEVIQFPGPKVAPTVDEVVTDAEAEARLLKVLEEMFYGDAPTIRSQSSARETPPILRVIVSTRALDVVQ